VILLRKYEEYDDRNPNNIGPNRDFARIRFTSRYSKAMATKNPTKKPKHIEQWSRSYIVSLNVIGKK